MYMLQKAIKYVFALAMTILLWIVTLDLLGMISAETCFTYLKEIL